MENSVRRNNYKVSEGITVKFKALFSSSENSVTQLS